MRKQENLKEEIEADYREVLRLKAKNHSLFYRQISNKNNSKNDDTSIFELENESIQPTTTITKPTKLITTPETIITTTTTAAAANEIIKSNKMSSHINQNNIDMKNINNKNIFTNEYEPRLCDRDGKYFNIMNVVVDDDDDDDNYCGSKIININKNKNSDGITTNENVCSFNNNNNNNNNFRCDDNLTLETSEDITTKRTILSLDGGKTTRQRKTVVYNFTDNIDKQNDNDLTKFPCVDELVKMYATMIKNNKNNEIRPLLKCSIDCSDDRNNSNIDDDNNNNNINNQDDCSVKKIKNNNTIDLCENENENDKDKLVISETGDEILLLSSNNRTTFNRSPISDEGCSISQNLYSSDDDDGTGLKNKTINLNSIKRDKVVRSSSSDSALGLDDDIQIQDIPLTGTQTRRMTLTVSNIPLRSALLPLAEPTTLPCCESTTNITTIDSSCGCPVRSKMILEAQVIEIPSNDVFSGNDTNITTNSRRESSQSCTSIDDNQKVRYMRTPSVVVSDYSDEMMCGITLEEIEYFRRQRLRRNSFEKDTDNNNFSDMSASSSCSNLNYCGSHISILDNQEYSNLNSNNGGLCTPERKISNCSTCSTISGDEDETFQERLTEALEKKQKKKVCSKENKIN